MNQALTLPGIGDLVDGRFRIDRMLGEGGTSTVYEVVHVITEKRFAIKWLLPELALEDAAVDRFIHEARVGSRFAHPLAVQVFDICRANGSFYMLMELLQGESLQARLERVGRLDVQTACSIMLTCADVLSAAHRGGIIHRDLKPANIFLCMEPDGLEVPKLLDFGISTFYEDLQGISSLTATPRGSVIGTPLYMSPEQMLSRKVDPRADIYALGAVLYELVSGQPPFQADSYAELVVQVTVEANPTPLQAIALVDPQFAAVVAKAMAREPDERFQTVEELIVALRPYSQPLDASSIRAISALARPAFVETTAPGPEHTHVRVKAESQQVLRARMQSETGGELSGVAGGKRIVPWARGAGGLALVGAFLVASIPSLMPRAEPGLSADAHAGEVRPSPAHRSAVTMTGDDDALGSARGATWDPPLAEMLTGRATPDGPEAAKSEARQQSEARRNPRTGESAVATRRLQRRRGAGAQAGEGSEGGAEDDEDDDAEVSSGAAEHNKPRARSVSEVEAGAANTPSQPGPPREPWSQVRIRRSDFGAPGGAAARQPASQPTKAGASSAAAPPNAAVSRDDF